MKMHALIVATVFLGGCATQTDASLSKEEAAAYYAEHGKADGVDFCDELGWYGDGFCDPWCPLADHDCTDDECTVGADSTCAPGESCTPGYCYFYCPVGDESCCAPATCEPDEDPGDFCPRALCGPGTVCNEETDSCEPECIVGGCSGQLCVSADAPPPITTCEALPEYECYDDGVCERQPDGACGWTVTPEMQMCLDEHQSDCRSDGCAEGDYCSFCWGTFQCIPDGAVC